MSKRRFDYLKERLSRFALDSDIGLTDLIVSGDHALIGLFETERDRCVEEEFSTLHLLLNPKALKRNPDHRYLNIGVKCGLVFTSGNRSLNMLLYVFRVEKINLLVHPEWETIKGVHHDGVTFARRKFLDSSPTVSQENKKKINTTSEFVHRVGRSPTKDEVEYLDKVYTFLENKRTT